MVKKIFRDSAAVEDEVDPEELARRQKDTIRLRILLHAEENQPFLRKHEHYMQRDKSKRLKPEREDYLWQHSDEAWAREEILTGHMWLCVLGVIKYCRNPKLYDDAFGEAVLALLKAYDDFDSEEETRFKTLASMRIEFAIKRHMPQFDSPAYIPPNNFFMYRKYTRPATETLPDPAIDENAFISALQAQINKDIIKNDRTTPPFSFNTLKKTHRALQEARAYTDEAEDDENGEPLLLHKILFDPNDLTPAEIIGTKSDMDTLYEFFGALDEREVHAIRRTMIDEITLNEVAAELHNTNSKKVGMTYAAAQIIRSKALEKLRIAFDEASKLERRRSLQIFEDLPVNAIASKLTAKAKETASNGSISSSEWGDFYRAMNEAMKKPPKFMTVDEVEEEERRKTRSLGKFLGYD